MGLALVASVIAAILPVLVLGQETNYQATETVRISGRITDIGRGPIAGVLKIENSNRQQQLMIVLDRDGGFSYVAITRTEYVVSIMEPSDPVTFIELGMILAADGRDFDLGDLLLNVSLQQEPVIKLVGPVRIWETVSPIKASLFSTNIRTPSSRNPASIVAIFIGAEGTANIIESDGRTVKWPKEGNQVNYRSPQISEDRRAVGWLAEFPSCCTSYPVPLRLVIFKPGRPISHFMGDGREISDWRFVSGGKQVAFYQASLHGTPAHHYELRDVGTERLVGKWDGALSPKAPRWTSGLRH